MICLFFWSFTFHCPKDLFYRIFGESKLEKIFSVIREVERVITIAKISDSVLSTGQSPFSAFIVSFITVNLSYHIIYLLDQLIRGVSIRKHELIEKSFTSKITLFVAFAYNYNKFISNLKGQYFLIDIICITNKLQLIQIITILATTLKTLYYFGFNVLRFDESILLCPLTKFSCFFSFKSSASQTLRPKRSVAVKKDDMSYLTTDDEDKAISNIDDSPVIKKRRATSRGRPAGSKNK